MTRLVSAFGIVVLAAGIGSADLHWSREEKIQRARTEILDRLRRLDRLYDEMERVVRKEMRGELPQQAAAFLTACRASVRMQKQAFYDMPGSSQSLARSMVQACKEKRRLFLEWYRKVVEPDTFM